MQVDFCHSLIAASIAATARGILAANQINKMMEDKILVPYVISKGQITDGLTIKSPFGSIQMLLILYDMIISHYPFTWFS